MNGEVVTASVIHEIYRVLQEADEAAKQILARRVPNGETTWKRWLAVGRAVELVHRSTRNTRLQGKWIAQYENLSSIPSVTRSDAKWVWLNKDSLEGQSADGLLRLGHPSEVRKQLRNLSKPGISAESGHTPDQLANSFVERNHNNIAAIRQAFILTVAAFVPPHQRQKFQRTLLAAGDTTQEKEG